MTSAPTSRASRAAGARSSSCSAPRSTTRICARRSRARRCTRSARTASCSRSASCPSASASCARSSWLARSPTTIRAGSMIVRSAGCTPVRVGRDPRMNQLAQLPAPTTTFVGRANDREAIARWFATGHRLVVIVGPPGMGKTRVAIEYAAALAARGGAVRFCDLTEVRDLDELCAQVAACLGLSLEPGADVAASIGLALARTERSPEHRAPARGSGNSEASGRAEYDVLGGRMQYGPGEGGDLLVLDNFEQLVDACAATVASWLVRAPRAQLLVTSRERLRIDGEVVHELEPLSLPAGADPAGPAGGRAVLRS